MTFCRKDFIGKLLMKRTMWRLGLKGMLAGVIIGLVGLKFNLYLAIVSYVILLLSALACCFGSGGFLNRHNGMPKHLNCLTSIIYVIGIFLLFLNVCVWLFSSDFNVPLKAVFFLMCVTEFAVSFIVRWSYWQGVYKKFPDLYVDDIITCYVTIGTWSVCLLFLLLGQFVSDGNRLPAIGFENLCNVIFGGHVSWIILRIIKPYVIKEKSEYFDC